MHCVLLLIRVETLVPVRLQLAAVGSHKTGGEALRVKVLLSRMYITATTDILQGDSTPTR